MKKEIEAMTFYEGGVSYGKTHIHIADRKLIEKVGTQGDGR